MSATHHHSAHPTTKRRLGLVLLLTALIVVAEAVGGLLSGSLALLADAGHMLTDLLALIVAFAATMLAVLPPDDRRTYGYKRVEILAALVNGVALVVISSSILYHAVQRYLSPKPIAAGVMGAVAAVGLVANLLGLLVLRNERGNLNLRAAFLHILADTLSSLGVLVGAAVIALTGWHRLDPVLSVAIAVVIVITSLRLLREVLDVLLEAAPRGIDTEQVRQAIVDVPGVDQVHDLHVWSITSNMPALSAHVVVRDRSYSGDGIVRAVEARLRHDFAIEHSTLQIEREPPEKCGCSVMVQGP